MSTTLGTASTPLVAFTPLLADYIYIGGGLGLVLLIVIVVLLLRRGR